MYVCVQIPAILITNIDYRYGRVNYVLAKRLELLNLVKKLQHSLNIPGEDMHTCETAGHFFLYRILARWEKFLSIVKSGSKKVKSYFTSYYFKSRRISSSLTYRIYLNFAYSIAS